MKILKKISFLDLIIFFFVLLFVYAATSKILTFDEFQAQIGKSPLIMNYAKGISYIVPILEIFISFMLLTTRTLLYGLYFSFFLMFTFTAYIAFILAFSPYVPCSCGGILNNLGWGDHMIFNIVFVMMSVAGIVLYNKRVIIRFAGKG